MKKEKFYFMHKDKIEEIPSGKKKAEKIFNKFSSGKDYLTRHKINFKSKEELKALVNFMNQSYLKS